MHWQADFYQLHHLGSPWIDLPQIPLFQWSLQQATFLRPALYDKALDHPFWGPPLRQPHQTPTGSAGGPGSESPSTFIASWLPPSLPSFVNSTLDLKSKSSTHDVSSPSIYARLVSIPLWYVQNYVFPVEKKYCCLLCRYFQCTQICVHKFNVHTYLCIQRTQIVLHCTPQSVSRVFSQHSDSKFSLCC